MTREGTLQIGSVNCWGLRGKKKRNKLFNWIRCQNINIIMLQDTHCDIKLESEFKMDWGEEIVFAHTRNTSRGVYVLCFTRCQILR